MAREDWLVLMMWKCLLTIYWGFFLSPGKPTAASLLSSFSVFQNIAASIDVKSFSLLLSSGQNSIFFMRPRGLPSISGIWLYLEEIVISIGGSGFFLLQSGCLGFDGRWARDRKGLVIFFPFHSRFLPVLPLVLLHLPPSLE